MRVDWKGQLVQIRELGQGPAVVLVHGYPLDGAMWSGVARTLSSRFRVLKPDLPGRGENPAPPDGTIDGYADFLQAILAEIPPPAGLAGFSMGGYASLALMKREPAGVRALALVDTRAGADDEAGRAAREAAIATVRSGGAAAIADGMIPKLLAPASAAEREPRRAAPANHRPAEAGDDRVRPDGDAGPPGFDRVRLRGSACRRSFSPETRTSFRRRPRGRRWRTRSPGPASSRSPRRAI